MFPISHHELQQYAGIDIAKVNHEFYSAQRQENLRNYQISFFGKRSKFVPYVECEFSKHDVIYRIERVRDGHSIIDNEGLDHKINDVRKNQAAIWLFSVVFILVVYFYQINLAKDGLGVFDAFNVVIACLYFYICWFFLLE
jgi:hypothetical protein